MSEQITWTHVDKLVRKMHDNRGMLPTGLTDAEVAYSFIKILERSLQQSEICAESRGASMASLKRELDTTRGQLDVALTKSSKTKQRLAKLEEQVAKLLEWADRE